MSDEKNEKGFWQRFKSQFEEKAEMRDDNILPSHRTSTQEAETNMVKYVLAMNAGATVASVALIGQIAANLSKPEILAVADGIRYFLHALIIIGFGLIIHWISHLELLAGRWLMHALLRWLYLGSIVWSFWLFVQGTSDVLDALVAAY